MIQRTSEIFLWEITHAHSVFLEALLNLGIVGLIAYSALLLSTLGISAKATLYTRRPEFQLVFTVTLFALIHGLAEASFYSLGFESYALLFLIYRISRECPNFHRTLCFIHRPMCFDEIQHATIYKNRIRCHSNQLRQMTIR